MNFKIILYTLHSKCMYVYMYICMDICVPVCMYTCMYIDYKMAIKADREYSRVGRVEKGLEAEI